jgi:hypothetical protein
MSNLWRHHLHLQRGFLLEWRLYRRHFRRKPGSRRPVLRRSTSRRGSSWRTLVHRIEPRQNVKNWVFNLLRRPLEEFRTRWSQRLVSRKFLWDRYRLMGSHRRRLAGFFSRNRHARTRRRSQLFKLRRKMFWYFLWKCRRITKSNF